MNLTVIDSIMGSGKTTWMLNRIKTQHEREMAAAFQTNGQQIGRKYIYITPTLDEVDRVTAECSNLDFRNPEPIEGRKLFHLDSLIAGGHNICTTHSLFRLLTQETYKRLKDAGYTLVIDEVLNCVDLYTNLSGVDQAHLFQTGMVKVDSVTKKLKWNEVDFGDYRGRFEDIQALCRNGNLVRFKEKMLIWEFPIDFLKCFDHVFILTYLFHGSAMASYLASDRVVPSMMAVQDGQLMDWDQVDEAAIKAKLRKLISIYEGPMNKVGDQTGKEHPLSSSWYDRASPETLSGLQVSTGNYFKRVAGTASRFNAWTTFKKVKPQLSGKPYSKGFLPNNLRATNDHIDKTSMAYLCNTFYHPIIRGYFTDRQIEVYEDLFTLSEMLQWLWRGQIRRGDPIQVFIPSSRMRALLKMWLESDTTDELFRKAGYGGIPQTSNQG